MREVSNSSTKVVKRANPLAIVPFRNRAITIAPAIGRNIAIVSSPENSVTNLFPNHQK